MRLRKQGNYKSFFTNSFKTIRFTGVAPKTPELVGFISVADSLEHLYQWFSRKEILKLQENGFSILEYQANDYKFYDLYKHNVINQNSILYNKIKLI